MSLEGKIRFVAAMRVKVHITKRRRSKAGFVVQHPRDHRGRTETHARTRREALSVLWAKVHTTECLRFAIKEAS